MIRRILRDILINHGATILGCAILTLALVVWK